MAYCEFCKDTGCEHCVALMADRNRLDFLEQKWGSLLIMRNSSGWHSDTVEGAASLRELLDYQRGAKPIPPHRPRMIEDMWMAYDE